MNTVNVPRDEYTGRLERHRAAVADTARQHDRIANARLFVFLAGLVIALVGPRMLGLSLAWVVVPLAMFVALIVIHARVLRGKARSEALAAFYESALARLDGCWSGKGLRGEEFVPEDHPYARDLDLFGEGSLYELLCAARTRAGERALAAWLCEPVSADVIRARQDAIRELRSNLDLREDLALYGGEVRTEVNPEALSDWATAPSLLTWRSLWRLACVVAVFGLISIGLFFATGSVVLVSIMILVNIAFRLTLGKKAARVSHDVDEPGREMAVLAKVLARLEREPFESDLLRDLQAALSKGGVRASRRIAALSRLIELREVQHNQVYGPLVFPLMWWLHLACAFERWRERWGRHVPRWIDAVGELEALCSIAAYAYEHPDDAFPEIVDDGPVFEADDIGHPLLPSCIRNDVLFGRDMRLFVVSGANMSGKSTLLRTVGINTILAQLGAPAHALHLKLSPLAIGATLRVQDSIRHGISHFYAEIRRLKQTMDLVAGPFPVLFLLDEILHGTNSHDRQIGAGAVVTALVKRGAIGLITTHDLAVTEIVESLRPRAANVHFTDTVANGRLAFDYKLRPGIVQAGNALNLMRSIGLDV